jgi:hypothetical protein
MDKSSRALTTTKVGKDVAKMKHSYTVSGNRKPKQVLYGVGICGRGGVKRVNIVEIFCTHVCK